MYKNTSAKGTELNYLLLILVDLKIIQIVDQSFFLTSWKVHTTRLGNRILYITYEYTHTISGLIIHGYAVILHLLGLFSQ